jgi:hypothetical protein
MRSSGGMEAVALTCAIKAVNDSGYLRNKVDIALRFVWD